MSGQTGTPQENPPGERLQNENNEGLQRQFLQSVDISPNSIINDTPTTTVAEHLQQPSPTPNPSTQPEGLQSHRTQTVMQQHLQAMNQFGSELVQSHGTLNTSINILSHDPTRDTHMTEAQPGHVTQSLPGTPTRVTGHLTASDLQTPQHRLIPTAGQTVLRPTRHGETPADYVSISSEPSTPSPNPKRSRTSPGDAMEVETYGYQSSESPSRLPTSVRTTPSNTTSPPNTYASMLKGKGKEVSDTSLLSRTRCKLQEFDESRIPPITDAKYSAWLDLTDVYEDQEAIFRFAAENPNICGLSHRPTSKWTEFYCKTQVSMEALLENSWTLGTTEVKLVKAKKLAGSRVFLKFTNVTPCHSEDEIREHISKHLQKYGTPGEIEPHYIVDFTGDFPEANLCTRRWDAEIFVPEKTRLIMDPIPLILDTETVIYWKGQFPVCHNCKIIGHWAKNCNSVLRAKAQADKLAKIPPAPIMTTDVPAPQPDSTPTPDTTPATKEQPENVKKTPTKATPQQQKEPQKQPEAPKTATKTVKERDLIQKSREVNAATGNAPSNETVIIRDDGWETVDYQKKRKPRPTKKRNNNKTESESEERPSKKKTLRSPTAIEVSNRPRTVGNQLQYYLYMVEQGHILRNELQSYLDKADPITFITVTKPSMKVKTYESFTNWVGRRRRTNQDDVKDITKWKVSIPDHMNPTNEAFVDTSISQKQYNEQEAKRKNKTAKLTVKLTPQCISTNEVTTQELTFKPRDRMTTIIRAIKKKFAISFQMELSLEGHEGRLNTFVIADKAGLKDGSIVLVHKATSESSTEASGSGSDITVRVQRLSSSKLWQATFPYTASTTHLYHAFQEEHHLQHGSFTLLRSDKSRISRFTTLGNLNLRRNEVLIYRPQEPVLVGAKWLDNRREPQDKFAFIDKNLTVADLKDVLLEELLLDFTPSILVPGVECDETETLAELSGLSSKLDVLLYRIGQQTWDDVNFEVLLHPKEIMTVAKDSTHSTTLTMEVTKENTVADFANQVYTAFPELKGRILEDSLGLPYQLSEMADRVVPASGVLRVVISPTLEYSASELSAAVNFVACMRSTTKEELLVDEFKSFAPCE